MVPTAAAEPTGLVVKDENGTTLTDGDTVIVVKNLKVRGATSSLKVGTAHRSSSVSTIKARIDFEPPGGVRFRAWSTEGKDRTLIFNHFQSEANQ